MKMKINRLTPSYLGSRGRPEEMVNGDGILPVIINKRSAG
jgi:hypothetical protein